MKKFALAAGLLVVGLTSCLAQPRPGASRVDRPARLVVAITVDQFRYDYLTRFRKDYKGGLARLLERGAVFTDAHHEHFPTVTAIGHATYLSGATPSVSGIVGNEWFDRETNKQVTSVSDEQETLLGGKVGKRASSPKRLLVSTLSDELKMAGRQSKAIGISLKDRGAILPVGRMADAAYWFDAETGNFVSSTYYFKDMPAWAAGFNAKRPADRYLGKAWLPFDAAPGTTPQPFVTLPAEANNRFYNALTPSPFSNELIEEFAEQAVVNEKLGQREDTDVLAISFSANDYVGHALGPDHPAVRDISVQTDRLLARLFDFLDKQVGMDNVIVVYSADHGVAPMPEVMKERRMPGGRMTEDSVLARINQVLSDRYGAGAWVVGQSGPAPYLNYSLIEQKKLNAAEVRALAAAAVRTIPHIQRVYTRDELQRAEVLNDLIDRRVRNGFHAERAADLFIVVEPYWLFEQRGTSHGTPYNYDSHVPVIFLGRGIRPGRYHQHVATMDVAPTLAALLDVEPPSGSAGRVLTEMLSPESAGRNGEAARVVYAQ